MTDRSWAQRALSQLDALERALIPKERERTRVLISLADVETRTVSLNAAHATLFPHRSAEQARRTLTRLAASLNRKAHRAQVGLRLVMDTNSGESTIRFEERPSISPVGDRPGAQPARPSRNATATGPSPETTERDPEDHRPIIKWFLSYSHRDLALKEQFFIYLKEHLDNSPTYAFEVWHDGLIVLGQDWYEQIERALDEAHLAVFLVSQSFLASEFIAHLELPAFVSDSTRAVVPALVRPVDFEHTNLKGLQEWQVFVDKDGKAFVQHRGYHRETWVAQLARELHRVLESHRHPSPPAPTPAPAPLSAGDSGPIPGSLPAAAMPTAALAFTAPRASAMLSRDLEGVTHLVEQVQGRPARLNAHFLQGSGDQIGDEVVVLDYLLDWLRERHGPPLFALLGEYGMGKTIGCQRLTLELERLREAGEGSLPQPYYFDLRNLTGLGGRTATPDLLEIMQTCIARGWRLDAQETDARALRSASRHRPCLFIFDGLDEALVRLGEVDGQAFTQELLRLCPERGEQRSSGVHPGTRLLISCRTHYFPSVQAQSYHFAARERDATRATDYRALLLLPLSDTQIRSYFSHALPELDVNRSLELIRSVHSLSALCARPFLMQLAAEYVPALEQARAEGRRLFAVTLYREMVARWLHRDAGKHQFKAAHKPRLMSHLAAWLWRQGKNIVAIDELEAWFSSWLRERREYGDHYGALSRDKLDEDLRTTTFLVREDGASGERAGSGFRFAHTAFREFFLAQYLFEAIQENVREHWALPPVSEETHELLGQLLAETDDPRLLSVLSSWRAPYQALASELWLKYALRARASRWPAPSLAGLDMRGALLSGTRFGDGRELLNLSQSHFSGATLRDTVWSNARLDGADFTGAVLQRAEWARVRAPGAILQDADCQGARFIDCCWSDSQWAGANLRRAQLLRSPLPEGNGAAADESLRAPEHEEVIGRWRAGRQPPALEPCQGHALGITSCAVSPDGSWVVSGAFDNTLKVWDVVTGECLATWVGHGDRVRHCAVSPNGKRVVSAGHDHAVRLWEVDTGACSALWLGHAGPVVACAFAPDGRRVASSGMDGRLKVWDVATGDCLWSVDGEGRWLATCAYAPDGQRIVTGGQDQRLRVWDASTGACLATWSGHDAAVTAAAFSPDGRLVVSGSHDRTLRLWDTLTGDCLGTLIGHQRIVSACAFSPDGQWLVSASHDQSLKLWRLDTAECVATFVGHRDAVVACAYASDASWIISASHDKALRVWEVTSRRCIATFPGHDAAVSVCARTEAGDRMLSAGPGYALMLWSTESGKCLGRLRGHRDVVRDCAIALDGVHAISASDDGTLRLWDLIERACVDVWFGHQGCVNACAFTRDGRHVVSVGEDDTVRVWSMETGRCSRSWRGGQELMRGMAVAPDGVTVALACDDHTVKLWDIASGEFVASWSGHEGPVDTCVFSPDGTRMVSASFDRTLKLWDVGTASCVSTWRGHEAPIAACAFSPDGRRVVSGSFDNTVRYWDVDSGACLGTWRGHRGPVQACTFLPDGGRVLSGALDGALIVWEVDSGRAVRIHHTAHDAHAVWVPDSARVLEASPGAFRWLDCRVFSANDPRSELVPAEALGPLQGARPTET